MLRIIKYLLYNLTTSYNKKLYNKAIEKQKEYYNYLKKENEKMIYSYLRNK